MTIAKFNSDPYMQQLSTKISAIYEQDGLDGTREQWFECEESIFYPNGGGQPGDIGQLIIADTALGIIDTRKSQTAANIRHQLDTLSHTLKVGDTVQLALNWPRRHRLMRMHSALHMLCSLIPRGVTGGSVGEFKSRLDFDLGEHSIDKQTLTQQLNALVAQNHLISTDSISEQELAANPALVRTMSVQPPKGVGDIRMIGIGAVTGTETEPVDLQPCGGTHVRSTAEIGELIVSKIENKGKRNRRIHIKFADETLNN
ncbi:MAG: misacylated tRNA(Ala) deacylase [Oceanospirillaceae bacterium]|jgi:misacylated tRNA(Ala) deacylase